MVKMVKNKILLPDGKWFFDPPSQTDHAILPKTFSALSDSILHISSNFLCSTYNGWPDIRFLNFGNFGFF